jgi:hypothetical protein
MLTIEVSPKLKVRTVTAVTVLCAQPKVCECSGLKRWMRPSNAVFTERKTFDFGIAAPTIDKARLPHENRSFKQL